MIFLKKFVACLDISINILIFFTLSREGSFFVF